MKYAFIYPGQGSQTLGMGKDFRQNFPIARELSEQASEVLHFNMNNLLDSDEDKLNQTQYTQPAIFLVSAMAHTIMKQEFGIQATLAFGHSLGEVSAYCLNGGATLENSILLTHKRGQFMAEACKNNGGDSQEVGMMVCLGLATDMLESICQTAQQEGLKTWAANYNLDNQIVLAGVKKDLEIVGERLKSAGAKRIMLLKMNVASHCPLLESCVSRFYELLEKNISDSELEIISNANVNLYKTKSEALKNLTEQLTKPVLYTKSVLKAKELGIETFIELGNGNILAGLNNKITDIPTLSIHNTESLKLLG
ncbi:[acyl-carrier-protein] S-malonyltransferase [Helicobacter didelphidarum]|uniref:Malonyl CoA-acyl carrier protein transacylase n=1 Tax=Helicobacter didelphidarum TaxID=2040648 RepID=A0A3D8INC0_9HELI|nr:ACP S-malonyltransferase [Helicobacter didelphidarum]RDU66749.1 [acyl-carrier-protein] S-malonyltransferase [Helicobacter didelphidarum]